MALPSSGPLSIGDIAAEFGGAVPHSLSEYYGAAAGVPSSGPISVADFYGTSSIQYATLRPTAPIAYDTSTATISETYTFTSSLGYNVTHSFSGFTLSPGRVVSAAKLYIDVRAFDGVYQQFPATVSSPPRLLCDSLSGDARGDLTNNTFPHNTRVLRESVALPLSGGSQDDFVYMNSDGADAIAFWGAPKVQLRVTPPNNATSASSFMQIWDFRIEITVTGI